MRVVMVIPSLGGTGGLERVATTLAVGIAPRVTRLVVCFARSGPHEQTLRDAGIELVRIRRPRPRPDKLLLSTAGLARVLRRERPDVVHAHNPVPCISAVLARLLSGSRQAAVVASYHGLTRGRVDIAALLLARSDLVIGVGAGSTQALEAHGLTSTTTIPNAALAQPQRSAREVRAELGAEGVPLILSVGRYVAVKNQLLLLTALAQVDRPYRAAIVGTGPLETVLRERAPESVTITGPRADAIDLVAAADMFVLSSDSEGLPLALLEAMVLGRPVVATAVGSIPDAVRDGDSALLVPPGDADALAAAIRRLLDDPDLAARLGAAAHLASREFSVETMIDRTLAAYAAAVERRQGRPT
jgi:glycosyltransferase involved in cell wall biosynthesis